MAGGLGRGSKAWRRKFFIAPGEQGRNRKWGFPGKTNTRQALKRSLRKEVNEASQE